MAMVCKICSHPERLEIDRQLVQGAVRLKIAREYGFTPSSVDYHAREHISRQLLKSQEIKERIDSSKLLDEVETCLNKTKDILFQAERDKKATLQLQAIREIRSTIELLLKLGIDLARLQQEKEIAEVGAGGVHIVHLPAINNNMSAKEASRLYIESLKLMNQNPSALVMLPEERNIEDCIEVNEPPKKMTRTTRPSGTAERVKASVEEDQDEITDILNWTPPSPARTGWPGARR